MIDPTKPYNQVPSLPPARFVFDDVELLKASMSAMSAISSLNATIRADISNISHSIHMMSPLFVPEAVTSSGVENIITTNERVYEARLLDENELRIQDKEVMRYVQALEVGLIELTEKNFLATNQFLKIQETLEPSKMGFRKLPGTQLSNPATGQVYYTPPDSGRTILSLLKNFEEYFNASSPSHEVLARAAILHYQFEAIHPFYDGNGRTGRILLPLYLTAQGLLDGPLLFVSKFILENRDEYYRLLRGVTFEDNWQDWVMYVLRGIELQSKYTLDVLRRINFFKAKLEKKLEKLTGHSYARDIAHFLYEHPYFTQVEFEQALQVSYVTARKYLAILVKDKIAAKKKQANRNRFIYVCPEYIKLLKNS